MLPYQEVDIVIEGLLPFLQKGDTIIDGGNSPYKKSIRHARGLEKKGIDFLDVGVSGGPAGARDGACIMVGGKRDVFERLEGLFRDLSVKGGYGYMGKSGAGHFVKMVHNGIEYGMMQAIAEGFTFLKTSPFNFDLLRVAELYNHGSVIESRLVGWLKDAFEEYGEDLNKISGSVSHSGEGLWTVEEAKEFGIPLPIIEGALSFRIQSLNKPSYTGQILSALRHQFGRHEVSKHRGDKK
jgi:6-phosphogluconate dehydrogenase